MADGIECTGHALSVVRGWFKDDNIEDDELDADAGPSQPALVPRPARLGLGAKFLPHHKAAALLNPVERRLARQLRESGGQEQDRGAPAGPSGKGKGAAADGKGAGKGATAPAREVSDGSDSDNEDMRSAALSRKRPQPAGLPAWQAGGKQSSKKRRKANKVLQQAAQRGGF